MGLMFFFAENRQSCSRIKVSPPELFIGHSPIVFLYSSLSNSRLSYPLIPAGVIPPGPWSLYYPYIPSELLLSGLKFYCIPRKSPLWLLLLQCIVYTIVTGLFVVFIAGLYYQTFGLNMSALTNAWIWWLVSTERKNIVNKIKWKIKHTS